MDKERPIAEAVAIQEGNIIAVGSLADLHAKVGANTKTVDLQGKTMLPGFFDPHMHFSFCYVDNWVDLGPFVHKNMDEVKQTLLNAVAAAKPGDWIMCQLLDFLITPGEFDVSKKGLDEISNVNPIFILESNGHIAHVNSLAFSESGITNETPDPDFGRFIRDENGELTG